jgi:hypothetical protein
VRERLVHEADTHLSFLSPHSSPLQNDRWKRDYELELRMINANLALLAELWEPVESDGETGSRAAEISRYGPTQRGMLDQRALVRSRTGADAIHLSSVIHRRVGRALL